MFALTNYLVHDVPGRYMVGLRISNAGYMEKKVESINLKRRDQSKPGVVWDVLGKVIQSNDKSGLRERLEFDLNDIECLLVRV
jgi:hypothetical protein